MRYRFGGFWFPALLALAAAVATRSDEVQWRPSVSARVFHGPRWELFAYGESWISDTAPNPAFYQLSPRLRYHAWEALTLGLNYSFIEIETRQSDHRYEQKTHHRLELEANPHWKLAGGWNFTARNRLEIRWIEDRPEENYRSRHLLEAGYPLKLPRPLQGLFSQGEFFYDWSRMRNSEYRFAPLGVDLRLGERASLRLYYLWRVVEQPAEWATSHVFWTALNLRLD